MNREIRAYKALQDLRVNRAFQDLKALKAIKGIKAQLAPLAHREMRNLLITPSKLSTLPVTRNWRLTR